MLHCSRGSVGDLIGHIFVPGSQQFLMRSVVAWEMSGVNLPPLCLVWIEQ